MGALQDGNIPAVQSGTVALTPGLISVGIVTPVYLTPKSWIGVVPLNNGTSPGHLRVQQQFNGLNGEPWPTGYDKTFGIYSDDPDDDRLVAWVIITDVSDMGESYPGTAPPS